MRRMHAEEVGVDADLVRCLLREQFPRFAVRPMRVVEPWGTDNALWRLGDDLLVRLPRIHWAERQVAFEAQWLPRIQRHLPVPVPEPVAVGRPGCGYPFAWAIHRWIPGRTARPAGVGEPDRFAADLAAAVRALHALPCGGAPPATGRARGLRDYDSAARAAIDSARGLIDVGAATAVWDEAVAASVHDGPPIWVHGDLDGNCLVSGGELAGLVDWGAACAGDPAADVQVIWSNLFTTSSRRTFIEVLGADESTVLRSRGAALQQACAALPYYRTSYPLIVERSAHKLAALGVAVRL